MNSSEPGPRTSEPWRMCACFSLAFALVLGFAITLISVHAGYATAETAQTSNVQREALSPDAVLQGCNGSWSVVSSPNPDTNSNHLSAIAVVSPNNIWAVGYTRINGVRSTLTEHWDGTQWSYVPSPNSGPGVNELVSVAAYSSLDVWAVGNYYEGLYRRTLIEHWNGLQWSIVLSPNYGPNDNLLTSVDVRAPNDAWAVGYYLYNGGNNRAVLTQHWDGIQWSLMQGVNYPGADRTQLYAVAIAGPNDVWAAGWVSYAGATTLIEHWNGTEWSIIPSPNPGAIDDFLNALTVVSPTDIWAVGYHVNGNFDYKPLTLHWDGIQWSWVDSPSTTHRYNYLTSVSASSSNDVWAVGFYGNPETSTLTEHWDGTAWTIVPSPNISASQNRLLGVGAVASDDAWAVGYYGGLTLVERYTAVCVVTATPTLPLPLTPTETGTGTVQPSATRTATATATPGGNSATPTNTSTIGSTNTSTVTQTATVVATGTVTPTSSATPPTLDLRAFWYAYSPTCNSTAFVLSVLVESQDDIVPVTTTMNFNGTDFVVPPFTGHYEIQCSTGPCTPGHVIYTLVADSQNDVQETNEENNVDSHWHFFGLPCTPTAMTTATITPLPATATSTACTITFTDVPSDSTFYTWIRCLACRGIISGYSDGTFRPGNEITRGQLAKIVSNSASISDDPGPQIFEDMPPGSTFYDWVNRLANRGYTGGYPCGGEGEPCGPDNLPYFRPNANATRGQISKIVSNAAEYTDVPASQTFEDVPASNTFYLWIERLAWRGIMSGYPCGSPGEPCGPDNKPYFRWGNNATRGQTSKIVANTFFPSCQSQP